MKHQKERLDLRHCIKSVEFPKYNNKLGIIMSCNCNNDCDLTQSMSEAAEYNFDIIKGTTLDFNVVYKDATKRPVNLTGYRAKCIAQCESKSFTINAKIEDPCCGRIRLSMSPYETSKIFTFDYKYTNITEYTYQMDLISPSNHVYRILQGTIRVTPSAGA